MGKWFLISWPILELGIPRAPKNLSLHKDPLLNRFYQMLGARLMVARYHSFFKVGHTILLLKAFEFWSRQFYSMARQSADLKLEGVYEKVVHFYPYYCFVKDWAIGTTLLHRETKGRVYHIQATPKFSLENAQINILTYKTWSSLSVSTSRNC